VTRPLTFFELFAGVGGMSQGIASPVVAWIPLRLRDALEAAP